MIDSEHPISAAEGSSDPATSRDMGWKATRDRFHDIIRTEVAKLNPTEDARHPLELIIETSTRFAEVDGEVRITVVDDAGRPRTIKRNGQTVPFTLHDLLEELRLSHPILFNPPSPEPVTQPEPEAVSPIEAIPERDWLDVGSGQDRKEQISPPPSRAASRHLRRARAHSRLAYRNWIRPAAAAGAAKLRAARGGLPRRLDLAGAAFEDGAKRPLWGRPSAVMGTVALAALLAIGAFTLSGDGQPSDLVGDGPAVTGTVAAPRTPDPAPPAAAAQPDTHSLRGVPEVLDTATLSLNGEVIRLFGVEWAPGAGKPDDLTRYLQGREVVCMAAGPNDTYRCQVGGQDLSKVVLFNGGGRATPEATAELKAAADRARAAQVGVWSK